MANEAADVKLQASIFQRLHPRVYLEKFLAEGIRPDGREPATCRPASLNAGSISTANGSALVRLGETTVVCGIKAEIAEPDLDSPEDGFIVPNVELPALCSPKFKPGPPGEEAQVLSENLNQALIGAQVLPLSSLCIHPGRAVWVLYVDVICINYDGNAFDATLLAVMAALRNTRLPKPLYDEDTATTTCSRTISSPLQLGRQPLATSFGIFDGLHVLADPSAFEEPLLETNISVLVDQHSNLVSVVQLGVASLSATPSQTVIQQCIKIAQQRRVELGKILDGVR